MKRKKEIEYSIRFNAALIYIVVGLACCMMVFYLYNIRGSIGEQKKEIEQQKLALALTNKLVYTVSEIQSSGELYLSTKDKRYLRKFNHKILEVELIIDSISICTHKTAQQTGLLKLDSLLRRQYVIIGELGKRLDVQNPLQEVNKKLQDYTPVIKRDSIVVTTVKRDTVVSATRKKGFFKRLANVFSPAKDSVIVLSDKQVDTLRIERPDTSTIITRVDNAVRLAGEGYSKNIKAIEYNVGNLAASDKKIMEQISGLLLNMYGKTLNSIFAAIDKSEKIIDRNYTYSIIGGVVALVLVFIFIVLIVGSVNKGKVARLALQELNRKNLEIMESRHKLLLSVSHDIKTPLGSILGYLEMRKNDGHDVRSMQSSGNYILSLLENLIEFSSIEQGKLKISNAPFKLSDFFAAITEMFEPLAMKKGIAFEGIRDFDDELVLCLDQLKFKQIVANLLSNSVKYTTAGNVKLQLSYFNGELVCKITDTGAGIPPHYKEKIFVPFQRVERNNILAGGSGLGLYVVKGLVELMGGKIDLTSKVGEGSEFTVVLPAAVVENNIPQGKKHITIIDDDPVLLSMAAQMLCTLGHKVVTASAIEDIGACDIILADMEMGHFTGVDVLKSANGVPVVIMTARSDYDAADAHAHGFAAYLSKPFTVASLQSVFGGEPDSCNVASASALDSASSPAPANSSFVYDLPNHLLEELFDGDKEAMRETLDLLKSATASNMLLLRNALQEDDYIAARAVCHKMLPMFAQFGYKEAELLSKIEVHRNDEYQGWQEDVKKLLESLNPL